MGAKRKQPSFGEALQEVETILARLENDEVDIDDLSDAVKRAVELIGICREKLQRTELEVSEFVAALHEESPATTEQPEDETADSTQPGDGEQTLPL